MKNINARNRLSCQKKKKCAFHLTLRGCFPIPSFLQGGKKKVQSWTTAVVFSARLRERNARCVSYVSKRERSDNPTHGFSFFFFFFFFFFFGNINTLCFLLSNSRTTISVYSLITSSRWEKNGRPIFGTYRALCIVDFVWRLYVITKR